MHGICVIVVLKTCFCVCIEGVGFIVRLNFVSSLDHITLEARRPSALLAPAPVLPLDSPAGTSCSAPAGLTCWHQLQCSRSTHLLAPAAVLPLDSASLWHFPSFTSWL